MKNQDSYKDGTGYFLDFVVCIPFGWWIPVKTVRYQYPSNTSNNSLLSISFCFIIKTLFNYFVFILKQFCYIFVLTSKHLL